MEVANTQKTEMALQWTQDAELVGAALQLRTFAQNAAMNMLQMGRVLNEIKDRVPHGEWEAYVKTNAKLSERTAQIYMQAWREMGNHPKVLELGSSQIIKLLPMPIEEREKLLAEHDVGNMSIREMDREIKRMREEEQRKTREAVEAERNSGLLQLAREREKAEKRIRELETQAQREPEIREVEVPVIPPEMAAELQQTKEELERMAETNRELMDGSRGWMHEKSTLENKVATLTRELAESEDMIREQQTAMNEVQEELWNMKSAQARGDAERAPADRLTLDIFAGAVRQFIGACARLPQMHLTFAGMADDERRDWEELLQTVEQWAAGSRKALDTMSAEGGYVL